MKTIQGIENLLFQNSRLQTELAIKNLLIKFKDQALIKLGNELESINIKNATEEESLLNISHEIFDEALDVNWEIDKDRKLIAKKHEKIEELEEKVKIHDEK